MKNLYAAICVGLLLGACAKDPKLAIDQAFAAGNLAQAETLLREALAVHADRADLHALRYVLARHQALNGPEAGKDQALNHSIAEYEWLSAHFKLPRNYTDSDASLRAHAPALALLEAAGKSLYR